MYKSKYTARCIGCDNEIEEGCECYFSDDGVLCSSTCVNEYIESLVNDNLFDYREIMKRDFPKEDSIDYPIANWTYMDIIDTIESKHSLTDYFSISEGELERPFDEDWYRDR